MTDPHNRKPPEDTCDYNSVLPPSDCLEQQLEYNDSAYAKLPRTSRQFCKFGSCALAAQKCSNDEFIAEGSCEYAQNVEFLNAAQKR